MSLTKPPKTRKDRGIVASISRVLVGVVLLVVMGAGLWALGVAGQVEGAETVDAAITAPGHLVTVGDVTLHVREEGRPGQPAVLLIHDFDITGGRQWLAMTEALAGYRLIIPDMIDFGYSTRLEKTDRLQTVIGRAEILAELLAKLEVPQASVVGAGYGGVVAAQLATSRPDLIDRLVLIGAEIYGPQPKWYERFNGWPVLGEAYSFTVYGASSNAARRYALGCETGGWCPDEAAMAEREVTARVRGTTAAFDALGATPPATTLPSALSAITTPTLILWGENDTVTPLVDGQLLADAIEGAHLTLVPGTGHRPQLEDPTVTGTFIAEFLSS
ncbi:MAG: alpha/beta hydrolase [Acidimicrobiia bacterium]|nr:alpha/beta hydrolase [Acidimicrobiia bacterium]